MSLKQKNSGFSIVDMVTAVAVSGVLMGGTIQGKQMVDNSNYESFKQQINSYHIAVDTFKKRYNALPGDFSLASTKLSAPAGVTVQNGNGNGAVMGGFCNVANEESCLVWQHLVLAGLVVGDAGATDGMARREHAYGGVISSMATGDYANGKDELKVLIQGVPGDVAQRLDDELDDGNATTGNIARYGGIGTEYGDLSSLNLFVSI